MLAPNWLGDAVMAIPCLDMLARQFPDATIAVAARAHLAPLFQMVPAVREVVTLEVAGRWGGWLAAGRDAKRIRNWSAGRFDVAVLLPNSFRSAWMVWRAGIGERWGYAGDGRTWLLTRAEPRLQGVHQVEYYQRLVAALTSEARAAGSASAPGVERAAIGAAVVGPRLQPGAHKASGASAVRLPSVRIVPPDAARRRAREVLAAHGWQPGQTLIGMAPGAAYGTAKQWPPDRFAELAADLFSERVRTVLVGSGADRQVCEAIEGAVRDHSAIVNLAGATDLVQLAAVMAECAAFVSNDSGAMHLAAAVGLPVVAIFGSTREWETAPMPIVPRESSRAETTHAIITADVPCRPCMLRECPLEGHPCMTAIDVERVKREVLARLA